MALNFRKAWKKDMLSKKRYPNGQIQEQEPGAPVPEMQEEQEYAEQDYFELPYRGLVPEQVDGLEQEDPEQQLA
jgi:hypothetical protein